MVAEVILSRAFEKNGPETLNFMVFLPVAKTIRSRKGSLKSERREIESEGWGEQVLGKKGTKTIMHANSQRQGPRGDWTLCGGDSLRPTGERGANEGTRSIM